jgi:hypothetical protein
MSGLTTPVRLLFLTSLVCLNTRRRLSGQMNPAMFSVESSHHVPPLVCVPVQVHSLKNVPTRVRSQNVPSFQVPGLVRNRI